MAFGAKEGTNWGCLAAGLFLFLLALPALAGLALSDCGSPDLRACDTKQQDLVIWTLGLAAACLAILFGTNWLVGKLRKQRGN